MNHLAHLALAGDEPAMLAGSFLGDFVKGPLRLERPVAIEQGIALHRAIDAQTQRDEHMRLSAARFGADIRRIAPVFLDIIGDHFLTLHFIRLHGQPAAQFCARAHLALELHRQWFPPDAETLRQRLAASDGLLAYQRHDVVARSFGFVAKRLRMATAADAGLRAFEADYDAFEADFLIYYPQLQAFATERQRNAQANLRAPG